MALRLPRACVLVSGVIVQTGIHPIVVYNIKIDTRIAVDRNKVLLVSSKIAYIDETSKSLLWLTAARLSISFCYTAEYQLGHTVM